MLTVERPDWATLLRWLIMNSSRHSLSVELVASALDWTNERVRESLCHLAFIGTSEAAAILGYSVKEIPGKVASLVGDYSELAPPMA